MKLTEAQDKKVIVGKGINLGDGAEESKNKNRPLDAKGKVLEGKENDDEDDNELEEGTATDMSASKDKKRPQDEKGNVLEGKDEDEDDNEENDDDEDKEDIKEGVDMPVTRTGLISAFSMVEGVDDDDVDTFKKLKNENAQNVFATASKLGLDEAKSLMDSYREDEQPDVKDEKQKAEKVKKKEDLPIEEHLSAIFQGQNLTEEFQGNVKTLFETAINTRINEEVALIEEEASKEIEYRVEVKTKSLTEEVDKYLSYVVEEWKDENRLSLESGFKSEITEEFGTALKSLLEEFNVELPTEKEDLFATISEEKEELESKNTTLIEEKIALNATIDSYKRGAIVTELSENLADTEVEKLEKLIESVDYTSDEEFSKKVTIIKENYFPSEKVTTANDGSQNLTEENNGSESDVTSGNSTANAYANYVQKKRDSVEF